MSPILILAISLGSLGIIAVLTLLFCFPIRKLYYQKKYVSIYGKVLYEIAMELDLYLINNLIYEIDSGNYLPIDHILFGDKYIYVIKDRLYNGIIEPIEHDSKWRHHKGTNIVSIIDNPLLLNRQRVISLCNAAQLDPNLFISVVVVNDGCLNGPYNIESKKDFLVTKNKLRKLIVSLEKSAVSDINKNQLDMTVKDLARLNLRDKVQMTKQKKQP